MTWCQAGFEAAFEGLCRRFASAPFPTPPDGFTMLSSPRPMRAVVRGTVDSHAGPQTIVVKWHRADRVGDQVSKKLRGSKAEREGTVLRKLAAADVRVPEVLAYTAQPDLLVTAYRDDLHPIEPPVPDEHVRSVADDVAQQLGRALAAGLRARDLHPGNLAWSPGGAVFVDLGSASIGKPGDRKQLVEQLARWRYALGQHLSYAQRHRALVTILGDTDAARVLTPDVNERAREIASEHRRGRDRRLRRTRHFEHVKADRFAGLRRAVRRKAWSGPSIEDAISLLGPIAASTPLKSDDSVLRVDRDGQTFVVKRYAAPKGAKPPRPLRAFRRAFAMENRLVPCAKAQCALVAPDGSGVLVDDFVRGTDLHAWFHATGKKSYGALPHQRRRSVLERLGRTLRAMHDDGIVHRDLKAPNLLWHDNRTPGGAFFIVDHDGARIARGDVPWKRRARDLARLDASLPASRTDRMRVLRAYRQVFPRPPVDERSMAGWIDKHVRRKRGPSGVPK